MMHQGLEELLARAAGRSLDDGAKRVQVAAGCKRRGSVMDKSWPACLAEGRTGGPREGQFLGHEISLQNSAVAPIVHYMGAGKAKAATQPTNVRAESPWSVFLFPPLLL